MNTRSMSNDQIDSCLRRALWEEAKLAIENINLQHESEERNERDFQTQMKYGISDSFTKAMNRGIVRLQLLGCSIVYMEGTGDGTVQGFCACFQTPKGKRLVYDKKNISRLGK